MQSSLCLSLPPAAVQAPTVAEGPPGGQTWYCHQPLISIVAGPSLPALTPSVSCPKPPLAVTYTAPFHCTAFSPPFKAEFKCLLLSLLWTAATQLPQTSIVSSNISLFTSFSSYIAICLGGCTVYLSHFWTPQVWCLLGVKQMLTQWAKHLLKSAEVQWLNLGASYSAYVHFESLDAVRKQNTGLHPLYCRKLDVLFSHILDKWFPPSTPSPSEM